MARKHKIYQIRNAADTTKAFCESKVCKRTCLTSKLESKNILRLVTTKSTPLNCYQIYNIRELITDNKIKFLNSADCQVFGQLKYGHKETKVILTIDSGAQVSCLGHKLAYKLIGATGMTKLAKPDKLLQGANNTELRCLGKIELECTLAQTTCKVRFYIIKEMHNGILGLDAIRKFKLNITAEHISFKTNKQTNSILKVNELSQEIKFPMWVGATPKRKYEINTKDPVLITVRLAVEPTLWNTISFQNGAFYQCNCKIMDQKLCRECADGPLAHNTIDPGGELKVKYIPKLIYDLDPEADVFQVKIYKTPCMEGEGLIDAVPPGIQYDPINGLSISNGYITLDGQNTFNQIHPVPELGSEQMVQTKKDTLMQKEESCTHCQQAKYTFCSYKNAQCLELAKLKQKLNINVEPKCQLIKWAEFDKFQGKDLVVYHKKN